MNEPLEAQPLETTAIAVREPNQAVGILRPADSLDRIAEAFKEYQRVCETILDKSDYQAYEGKPRKKKSAWRKLATAFNVSTQVVKEEIERTETRHVLSASYTVCAYTGPKASPYRQFEAVGYCDINEKCCASSRGEKCHKAAWKGHYCCVNGCDGRKHWSHPDHDVKSTAQTRATNRAIADLIGCGEVSAEELVDEIPPNTAPEPTGAPGRSKAPTTPPKAAATPIPAQKPPAPVKLPTDATRAWAINELKANPGEANHDTVVEYFRALSQLMPNEQVTDLPLRFVPATHAELRALVTCIGDFSNGDRALAAFKPHGEADTEAAPKQPKDAADEAAQAGAEADEAENDLEPWVSFPMPWGKHAGVKLHDLDTKYLFGLAKNYVVETEYNGKPKNPATIEKDRIFRAMLDDAARHYGWDKEEKQD